MEREGSVRREVGTFSQQLSWRMVSQQSTKTRTLTIITELGQLQTGERERKKEREKERQRERERERERVREGEREKERIIIRHACMSVCVNIHEMFLCKYQ